ncbi:MAG: glycosyltransferase [Candidatus Levybacteria bacterium]|nr:glycosyltransferase [Candidatus Levybacteria bacterium]
MKVVIIIPTYNEKGNIERLIDILETQIFPGMKNHNMNILVADDNSPDGTSQEVRKLMSKWKNLALCAGEKKGLGAAYIRGMTYAIEKMNAELMFEMDADLSHDPKKIPEFLKKIDEGADMVVGTRYSQGGSIPSNWGFQRKLFSIFGNLLVRAILMRFSIHDWTGGFRCLKKEVFLKEKNELTSFLGYTFQVSFLHKAVRDGFKIAEVPINFTDRTLGRSKIAPREYIADLLKYVISSRIKELIYGSFGKFLVVGSTGFVINILLYAFFINNTKLSLFFSNIIAAQFAIFSNYNLNNLWTFKERKGVNLSSYLWKMLQFFITSNIGVWLIQSGTIKVGELIYGRKYPYIYFIIGTGLLLIWNFTMYSRVIWKKHPKK